MKHRLSIISLEELCQLEHIESDIITEIVEYGIVKPVAGGEFEEWIFTTSSVYWIKKAVKLYQDLEIDWLAVALIIELIQQRESLRKENELINKQLRRFIQ